MALVVSLAGCTAIHNAVNDYRTSSGLPALAYSLNLGAFAQAEANRLAATGQLVHSDLYQLLAQYPALSSCGETIGVFPSGTSAASVVAAWRASPPHDAILRGAWTMEGDASASSGGRLWVAAEFCA